MDIMDGKKSITANMMKIEFDDNIKAT